ncbi:MAG TPA: hypothetical protein VFG73_08155 [Rhodanobacteraceae bacterium]|nr:hypothetical protein [Rhodanobacteraceae bacterium]
MKALSKFCVPLLAAALLAGCGGGGGDGGAFTPPPSGPEDAIVATITADTQNLPLNPNHVLPFPGGPYTAEVTITLRDKFSGELANDVSTVNVSINPVAVATFSALDDPDTADVNEVTERWGQAPVNVVAGKATVFVTSSGTSGTATLTVSGSDSDLEFESASMDFTVGNVAAPVPATIQVSGDTTAVYLPGSGGASSTLLTALVTDAGHQPVPDPVSGNDAYNNVEFVVVGGSANGTLSGTAASGDTVSGDTIKVRTTKGVANAVFHAADAQGHVTVQAIADAADNNVDNGIDLPVTATFVAVVSDGKPYSVTITSPLVNAVFINSVSEGVEAPGAGDGEVQIPVDPDGTYSLTVSALVTDRQGNPVLPGTIVSFGAIDAPLTGYPINGAGQFVLSGTHGNPQEGGTLFTAPDGHFTVVPGQGPQYAAGPGDTLLVYGKAVAGNSDLESARTVAVVNSATSLHVTWPFNQNDTSGSSVDFGAVLPWVIGRADAAAIDASAPTDEHGTASVRLTYPINQLGKHVAIFAQADGATAADPTKKISDIGDMRFPGVAPAFITASPTPIPGNTTIYETVCLSDALEAPLAGLPVSFAFHDLGVGTGSVDGVTGAGTFAGYTDTSGCVVGVVKTSGIAGGESGGGGGEGSPGVTFIGAGQQVNVPIVSGSGLMLLASPSALQGGGGTVVLTLLDGSGNPVPGVQIGGSCTASGDGASVGLNPPPGVTNASGKTSAGVVASGLNGYGEANSGSCTFNTAGGEPEVTVTVTGVDQCTLFSPVPAQCTDETTTP